MRDARRRPLQILSIGLLLALGVGMYSAMSSMSSWRRESADASFAALRMHDLRVALADGAFASAGRLAAVARSTRDVTSYEERLVVPTQVDASRGGRTVIVPGRIVGAPARTVDRVAVDRGRRVAGGALLEQSFADHYDLPSRGAIRIAGGHRLPYSGLATAPEYFLVTAPGADFGAEANFAVLFTTLAGAQRATGRPDAINELVLRLAPGADPAAARAELGRRLGAALPGTGFTFTSGAQEPARRLLYKDAEGDQKMLDVFAALLLGAAVLAAFNLVGRTVESQRREIGVGMALGVEPRVLARRPVLLGFQIAVLGVLLGLPAGYAANAWLRTVMETFFPLPVLTTPLEPAIFARGAALGLALPLLATVLPIRRALRVTPVEAIRIGAGAGRNSGWAGLVKDVRLPGGSLANLPLRNVLRTPRRTLMTALGIAAVVTIVIALAGLIDSFSGTLDASRREALAGAADRLTVDLVQPVRADGRPVAAIAGAASVGGVQPSLRLPSTLLAGRRHIDAFVEVVPRAGRIWHTTLADGVLPSDRPGVLLARRAADDLHLRVGDTVGVRHPVPSGASRTRLVTTRLPVTGIHASPFRFVAYANGAAAAPLGVPGLVNRLSVVPATGRRADDVKRELLSMPAVAAVQGAAANVDAVDRRMDQFTDVLAVTVVIGMAMGVLIAFNTSAINADERSRENATMFAYGVAPARVVRGNVAEALLIGLLATAFGIVAGHGVLRWVVHGIMPDTLPDAGTLVSVAPGTYMLAVLAGIVAVGLAPLLTLRRLRGIDIPSTLRVVE